MESRVTKWEHERAQLFLISNKKKAASRVSHGLRLGAIIDISQHQNVSTSMLYTSDRNARLTKPISHIFY